LVITEYNNDFESRMSYLIGAYVGVGFASLFANYLMNVCFNTAAERQIKRARNELYKSIIRQDMGFFDKNTPGDLTAALIA
jgi:ABC-type multidrug transport system fused ATPase/permease subunit